MKSNFNLPPGVSSFEIEGNQTKPDEEELFWQDVDRAYERKVDRELFKNEY